MSIRLRRLASVALAALVLAAGQAGAQTYPERPVTIVVPFAAGGTTDIVARTIGRKLSMDLGKQFVVENKGGAGATIGMGLLAHAAPDGYTLMVHHQGITFDVMLYDKLNFNIEKDILPVAYIGVTPNVLAVTNALPIENASGLLDYAKAHPGALNYGSGGVGSAGHLSMELLQSMTGLKFTHIPYRGSGPAITDLISGQIQMMLLTMPAIVSHVQDGSVRALATSGAQRAPALADLPTMAESGVPGYDYTPWYGLFAPAATPPAIVKRLNAGVAAALADADVKEKLAAQGMQIAVMSQEQFAKIERDDIARWSALIRKLGLVGRGD